MDGVGAINEGVDLDKRYKRFWLIFNVNFEKAGNFTVLINRCPIQKISV